MPALVTAGIRRYAGRVVPALLLSTFSSSPFVKKAENLQHYLLRKGTFRGTPSSFSQLGPGRLHDPPPKLLTKLRLAGWHFGRPVDRGTTSDPVGSLTGNFAAQTSDVIGGSRRIPRPSGWPALLERMVSFAVEPDEGPDA